MIRRISGGRSRKDGIFETTREEQYAVFWLAVHGQFAPLRDDFSHNSRKFCICFAAGKIFILSSQYFPILRTRYTG